VTASHGGRRGAIRASGDSADSCDPAWSVDDASVQLRIGARTAISTGLAGDASFSLIVGRGVREIRALLVYRRDHGDGRRDR
jgi:hypothetical protein